MGFGTHSRRQRLSDSPRLIAGLMFTGRSNFASRARDPAQRLKQLKNGLFLCPDQSRKTRFDCFAHSVESAFGAGDELCLFVGSKRDCV